METKISDLLAVIHYTIIKYEKKNSVILEELQAIDEKIKTGQLKDYSVNDTSFFRSIVNNAYKEIFK